MYCVVKCKLSCISPVREVLTCGMGILPSRVWLDSTPELSCLIFLILCRTMNDISADSAVFARFLPSVFLSCDANVEHLLKPLVLLCSMLIPGRFVCEHSRTPVTSLLKLTKGSDRGAISHFRMLT